MEMSNYIREFQYEKIRWMIRFRWSGSADLRIPWTILKISWIVLNFLIGVTGIWMRMKKQLIFYTTKTSISGFQKNSKITLIFTSWIVLHIFRVWNFSRKTKKMGPFFAKNEKFTKNVLYCNSQSIILMLLREFIRNGQISLERRPH